MARMSGADADELEALGHRMVAAADRLNGIRDEVTAVVRQAQWDGDDALQFRDLWQFRLSALLLAATSATRDASVVIIRNAEQQRFASGTENGTVPSVRDPSHHGGGSGTSTAGDWDWLNGPTTWIDRLSAITGLADDTVDWMRDTGRFAKWADNPLFKNFDAYGAPVLKGASTFLTVLDVGIDVTKLGFGLVNQDWDQVKLSSVDLALTGITAGAMVVCPPVGLALGGAQVVWSFVPDDVKLDVINGVGSAAGAAWNGAVDVAEDVGGAVADLAQGGFNALGDVFGW